MMHNKMSSLYSRQPKADEPMFWWVRRIRMAWSEQGEGSARKGSREREWFAQSSFGRSQILAAFQGSIAFPVDAVFNPGTAPGREERMSSIVDDIASISTHQCFLFSCMCFRGCESNTLTQFEKTATDSAMVLTPLFFTVTSLSQCLAPLLPVLMLYDDNVTLLLRLFSWDGLILLLRSLKSFHSFDTCWSSQEQTPALPIFLDIFLTSLPSRVLFLCLIYQCDICPNRRVRAVSPPAASSA